MPEDSRDPIVDVAYDMLEAWAERPDFVISYIPKLQLALALHDSERADAAFAAGVQYAAEARANARA